MMNFLTLSHQRSTFNKVLYPIQLLHPSLLLLMHKTLPAQILKTSMSSLTSEDKDQLYDNLKHHNSSDYGDKPDVDMDELENQVKLSS
jgi:hypothetical protein